MGRKEMFLISCVVFSELGAVQKKHGLNNSVEFYVALGCCLWKDILLKFLNKCEGFMTIASVRLKK